MGTDSVSDGGGGPGSAASEASGSLVRGASIGRYVVLGLVGRGAMGEVYAAYDPELDRKVAVKLLRIQAGATDPSTTEAKSRLLREAQAIARLSHPNVIVVHDVGSFGDRVFIAMEFVDGHTVGYWLLAQERTWKEVLRVFTAAGHGLAAAHASQLVHRDFKSENVMMGRDDKVRVMDFGLARRVEEPGDRLITTSPNLGRPVDGEATARAVGASFTEAPNAATQETRILRPPNAESQGQQKSVHPAPQGTDGAAANRSSPSAHLLQGGLSTNLTQTGAILGTPAYMAPEQMNGISADARSDQFSFCVALYEALYREHPFDATTTSELFHKVRAGDVRPPPDRTRVPGWVRRVILRGLRVDAADRWPSMDALLRALHNDPVVIWRRVAIGVVAVAGIAAVGIAARRQGAREGRADCHPGGERFAAVWEPRPVAGSRRATIAAAFHASEIPNADAEFARTAHVLDRYVAAWSAMYSENCEATNIRNQQTAEIFDLRMRCLGDRWNEIRALSDVFADPSADVVENAVEAAEALVPPDRCGDIEALRATVSHSVTLWTKPGTMSLVAPRGRLTGVGGAGGAKRGPRRDPAATAADQPLPDDNPAEDPADTRGGPVDDPARDPAPDPAIESARPGRGQRQSPHRE